MVLAPESCGCALQDAGAGVADSPICNGLLLFMAILDGFLGGRCAIADPCSRIVGTDDSKLYQEYDFIVVGAGTAGSIVAGRLSENTKYNVLLIEAGGPDPVASRVPSFYRSYLSNAEVDWRYTTQPGPYCLESGGRCPWPRGKVVGTYETGLKKSGYEAQFGGSSLLNGMMYHRGHRADYDEWVARGATGWGWDDVRRHFDASEDNKEIGTVADAAHHATGGPMPIQRFRYQPEIAYDLLQAVNESGLPTNNDMNDPNTPDGFVIAQTFSDDGQRYTTARAYLKPDWQRKNLHVKLRALVTKVLFNGTRAIGVEYESEGQTFTVLASKEVILSAGALNTPQILMLSGVGPQESLKAFNIPVVADVPVGKQMLNHLGITIHFVFEKLENTQTLNWAVATDYLLERQGPMTSTGMTQVTGILYSSLANQTLRQPDLQFFFNGAYAECSATGVIDEPVGDCSQKGQNVTANGVALLPRSVGNVTLNSTDPHDPLLFFPAFFEHPDDMTLVKDAAEYIRRIFNTPIMQDKYGMKLDPRYNACDASPAWSDAWVECVARYYTDGQNHQLGTAAIGKVIDTELRVYKVSGLRVMDASSMPYPPTGNPQAVIMMVAERGVDLVLKTWGS